MGDLAERLWVARKQGSVVGPKDIPEPASIEEAYAAEVAVTQLSYAREGVTT